MPSASPSTSGRPASTTVTTGLPVAFRDLTSACWSALSSGRGLSAAPSAAAFSPTTTTVRSASSACATASSAVFAWTTSVPAGAAFLMP